MGRPYSAARITAAQAAVLLLLVTVGCPSPGAGVLLPGLVELWLGLTLAGGAAMCIGLLISAVANNADRALSLLPLLLVPQLVLSGGLLSLSEAPVLRWPSYLASSRWGFAALAGTVDLKRLEGPRAAADWLWRHDPASWGWDCAFLLLMSGLAVLVAGRSLSKTNV